MVANHQHLDFSERFILEHLDLILHRQILLVKIYFRLLTAANHNEVVRGLVLCLGQFYGIITY